MTKIISEEQFKSRSFDLWESYKGLKEKFPDDKDFKKVGRSIKVIRSLYGKEKLNAVRQLNYLEKAQISFDEERRALIVKTIELLKKLILHKKLNPEESPLVRPRKRFFSSSKKGA